MQFWALLVDSFRESLDRKIFWVMAALTMIVTLAMLSVGFESDRIVLFFGMWEPRTDHFNPLTIMGRSRIAGIVVHGLMDFFLGTIGVVLMIIATAGMFPSFTERGAIDVVLAKPIGRCRLFLLKYVTCLVFALVQASLFVVLTFLAMGLRWGVWVPGYLISIPLLVILFSYVFCVTVLVGVKTQSTIAAILLSIAAWVLFATPAVVLTFFDSYPDLKKNKQVYQVVRVAAWIPPKTSDIPYLAARWSQAGTSVDLLPESVFMAGTDEDREQMRATKKVEEDLLAKSPWISIGTSLAFEAVVLLAAMWSFAKRDY